jgi:hypothetical protein
VQYIAIPIFAWYFWCSALCNGERPLHSWHLNNNVTGKGVLKKT